MRSLSRPCVFGVSYSTGTGSVYQNGEISGGNVGLLRRVSSVRVSRHPCATAFTFAHAREPRRAMCFICVLGSGERIHFGFMKDIQFLRVLATHKSSRARTGNSCVFLRRTFCRLHHHPFDPEHWLAEVCLRVLPNKIAGEHFLALGDECMSVAFGTSNIVLGNHSFSRDWRFIFGSLSHTQCWFARLAGPRSSTTCSSSAENCRSATCFPFCSPC